MKSWFLFSALLWSGISSVTFAENAKDPLQVQVSLRPDAWEPGQTGEIKFSLELPKGFHAYEDQFIVEIKDPTNFPVGPLKLSPVKTWFDKFSHKERKGMEGKAELHAVLEAPANLDARTSKLVVHFTYQACAETFCLLPTDRVLEVPFKLNPDYLKKLDAKKQQNFIESIKNVSAALRPDQEITWLTFLLTFFAGVLTSLTPCVFPMIPITLGVLKNTMEQKSKSHLLGRALIYIAGMSLTYSSLGVLAAASGSVFGSLLGQTWFLVLICIFLFAMSMSLFSFFEVQIPAGLQTYAQKMNTHSKRGVFAAGLLSGLLAAPCVAPVLVGILSLVATQKSYLTGFALLLSYSWGLGIILLLIALSTGFLQHLPRAGQWMEKLKYALGMLVLGAFYYYLRMLLPMNYWVFAVGIGFVLLPFLLKFITFEKDKLKRSPLIFGLSIVLIIMGAALIFESTRQALGFGNQVVIEENAKPDLEKFWQPYDEKAFAAALASGKPTILDFYADWCAACHELANQTFSDSKVLGQISQFNLFRVDATQSSPTFDILKEKYKIVGLPTVLFFNKQGQLETGLSLFEFETPEKFFERIGKVQ